VAPDRLSAEGFGEQHPVADNGTEEGRRQNRRIAMRVTQK
jgi:outer membrane protein OmpA-like peptidoglycan-associated protein